MRLSRNPTLLISAALVGVAFYSAIVFIASSRYDTLILNPYVAWHSSKLALSEYVSGDVADGNLSKAFGVERVPEIADTTNLAEPSGITTSDKQAADLASKVEQIASRIDQLPSSEEFAESGLLPELLSVVNQDNSGNVLGLLDEQKEKEGAFFDELASDGSDVPSEQEISELLAKYSQNPRAQGQIPSTVLDRVEESTGISPDEINALFDQE